MVTASIFIVFMMATLPYVFDSYDREWGVNSSYSEEELRAKFVDHPAYIAMYERYPDAKEQMNYNQREHEGDMQIGITNLETGTTLMLNMYYNSYEGKVSGHPMCQGNDEALQIVTGDLFAVEFIESTDCVEPIERIVTPTPFIQTNDSEKECMKNNLEYMDNPNNSGEKIMNLDSVVKCFKP